MGDELSGGGRRRMDDNVLRERRGAERERKITICDTLSHTENKIRNREEMKRERERKKNDTTVHLMRFGHCPRKD